MTRDSGDRHGHALGGRPARREEVISNGRRVNLEVLDVEHLTLLAATCTVLRGRSGSGKTTLLNLIAGVALPSAGTIRVDDTDVLALSERAATAFAPDTSAMCSRASTCSPPSARSRT